MVRDTPRIAAPSRNKTYHQASIHEGGSYMPELGRGRESSLVDLTGMSIGDLADLDAALLDGTLRRLLPECGGTGDRRWERYAQDRRWQNYPSGE
jgi:hypothetical protein